MLQNFLGHPVLKHRQTVASPNYDTPSFTRNQQKLTKILLLYILLFVFPISKRTHKNLCTQQYAAIPPN